MPLLGDLARPKRSSGKQVQSGLAGSKWQKPQVSKLGGVAGGWKWGKKYF